MRIRSTKPEFWRSRRIAAVDWEDRFVLKGLESYVDDNGVGKDDIELIVGDLFQRDLVREPSRTLARVSEALRRLHEAGLLWRYEVDGTALLYVSFWESAQRVDKPNPGRLPRPDGTLNYKESVIGESFANIREPSRTFAPGTEEQGNRGTGEQTTTARENDEPAPPEPQGVVDDEVLNSAPEFVDNPSRPTPPKPTDAARTVVRTTLGTGYPRTTIDRLAVQVTKLARERHPDALIREALREWDRRADCTKAEFLPTVLGDIVKRSRAAPATNGHDDKVNGYLAFANQTRRPELEP
ncbi:hypothetical protein [Mycobacterium sp. 1465703.0]|uniref:hypothetical protein n=1 Tax=Mycobacterium sp. 1465703.0 TaxID=1834078 RepID=UPI0007FD3D45|nr:hypothetical protein [Mycobacterium sp. 1465703.0]OBI95573.1 hypothetical protein A5625_08135 [Mycobacterium sp. 1465703.0]